MSDSAHETYSAVCACAAMLLEHSVSLSFFVRLRFWGRLLDDAGSV